MISGRKQGVIGGYNEECAIPKVQAVEEHESMYYAVSWNRSLNGGEGGFGVGAREFVFGFCAIRWVGRLFKTGVKLLWKV